MSPAGANLEPLTTESMWARLAEERLESGDLRRVATARAAAAARMPPAFQIADG